MRRFGDRYFAGSETVDVFDGISPSQDLNARIQDLSNLRFAVNTWRSYENAVRLTARRLFEYSLLMTNAGTLQ